MGWLILLGRTMQDTTSYFNKTIRCQSAKEISMEYFYRECRIRRLYVLKTGSQRKELRFSYKAWHQTANIFNTARNSKGRVQQDCNAVIQR